MRNTRIVVALSLLFSTLLIGGALLYAPAMESRLLSGKEFLAGAPLFVLLLGLVGWPWVVAFILANKPRARLGAQVFAYAALIGAALSFVPISSAPSEGIGYFVLFYLLGVWIVGPLLLMIRSHESP
jgi:hypothetical protein